MKKKLYIAPDIINILTETADLIMSSTDVNNNGTQVGTGSDHGGGNAGRVAALRTASGAQTMIIT